jgi:benzoyl-CoA 2,3-dioxygenase component B
LPHPGFHRAIGVFSQAKITPEGEIASEAEWRECRDEWLPTKADGDFIASLMKPVWEPGQFAGWIAPPKIGIDNKPGDFEYVRLHMA